MSLAEGVASPDERHGLGIIHVHPGEHLPDVLGAAARLGHAHVTLGVDVDEADGVCSQRRLALPVTGTRRQLLLLQTRTQLQAL